MSAPRVVVDYEPIAGTYDGRYQAHGYDGVAEALRALAAGAGRVLEVGCGTGHWLSALGPLVSLAVGVDPSLGMLARAREHGATALIAGRANGLPFAGSVFDLILCVNALHHFTDPSVGRRPGSCVRQGW